MSIRKNLIKKKMRQKLIKKNKRNKKLKSRIINKIMLRLNNNKKGEKLTLQSSTIHSIRAREE